MKTALIIDDSRLARLTLKRLIVKHDMHVYESEGVAEALTWLEYNPAPDVIFLDILMPNIDGFEGLSMLKAEDHTKDIPVIMYSGDVSEESRVKARNGGASGYLPKPADNNRVDHLIKVLSKREKTHSAQSDAMQASEQKLTDRQIPQTAAQPSHTISTHNADKNLEWQVQNLTYRLEQLEKQQATAHHDKDSYVSDKDRDLTYLQRQFTRAQGRIRMALIIGVVAIILAIVSSILVFLN